MSDETPTPGKIVSQVFGETRHPTDQELATITQAANEIPLTLFAQLNRVLNERGMCATIGPLR